MVLGYFSPDRSLPYINVGVIVGEKIYYPAFVLDTGFSGDLKLDERMAVDLGITDLIEGYMTNANGRTVLVGMTQGYAEMEGRKASIRILIVDGAPLVGIGFLSVFGYTVIVDCKNKSVQLELAV